MIHVGVWGMPLIDALTIFSMFLVLIEYVLVTVSIPYLHDASNRRVLFVHVDLNVLLVVQWLPHVWPGHTLPI